MLTAMFARIARSLGIRHGREILTLAIPTILGMLSHTLMWAVDSAFLGHVSALALGAAGLGGLITWTVYCFFNGVTRITATFISQANGRGDDEAVAVYAWQGTYVALVAGAILTLVGFRSDLILSLTGNSAEVQSAAASYMQIRMYSAVATQLTMTLSGFFQGRKDVKTPMYAGIVANILNIVLDYLMIFGVGGFPAMGIEGAALATSIANGVNAAILVWFALVPRALRTRYRIHIPRPLDRVRMSRLIRVGIPLSFAELVDMISFSTFTALIGQRGEGALAASQITVQLISFSFMPIWGITTAATVLVGNEIGRRNHDRAERLAIETYRIAFLYSLGIGAVLVMARQPLFSIFTSDANVLAYAAVLGLLAAIFQIFDGLRMIGIGVLQGAGDTRFPSLLAAVVLFGIFVPGTWVVVAKMGGGVVEAWIFGSFCYLVMAAGIYLRFRHGAWKRIELSEA